MTNIPDKNGSFKPLSITFRSKMFYLDLYYWESFKIFQFQQYFLSMKLTRNKNTTYWCSTNTTPACSSMAFLVASNHGLMLVFASRSKNASQPSTALRAPKTAKSARLGLSPPKNVPKNNNGCNHLSIIWLRIRFLTNFNESFFN